MQSECNISPEATVLLASLFAIALADGKSPDELSFWGSFFTTIGDNLSMMAAKKDLDEASRRSCEK